MRALLTDHLPPAPLRFCLLLLLLACRLAPDSDSGARLPNRRPQVRITAGAASSDPRGFDYRVQFLWMGADDDGKISLFRWAVDDTASESAWHDTTGFGATIDFSATTGRPGRRHEASDWHTFYVRSVDNEFAVSLPDRRYFNAVTIAPLTRITQPVITSSQPLLPSTFVVRWEGEDLDSPRPDRKPVWYEYKLVRIPDFADTITVGEELQDGVNLFLDTLRTGDRARWVRVPKSVGSVELRDLAPSGNEGIHSYAFAVRAIDEAGAVEPDLVPFRNTISFGVRNGSGPIVTVSEWSLGSHSFPTDGDVWEDVNVFVGRPYRFRWMGDASGYGSEPGNVNYALDISDPANESLQDPRGRGGWIGWGRWEGNQDPIVFSKDQADTEHMLYIYMRDVSNSAQSTRQCRIRLHVLDFKFDRFALLVDDAYLNEGVRDPDHDLFVKSTVLPQLYRYGTVDEWQAFGPGDASTISERLPDDVLIHYQHIVWNLNFSGGRIPCLFKTEAAVHRSLSGFLSSGGRLFLLGAPVLASLMGRSTIYPMRPPAEGDDREREQFYYRFLYVRNTVEGAGNGYTDACDHETGGMVLARSLHPNYPDLPLDAAKWNPEKPNPFDPGRWIGGISGFEGFHRGLGETSVPLAGLDSLYEVRTWNRSTVIPCRLRIGPADHSVCAWRYESTRADTLAQRQHGRVMVFDLQPWYFDSARLRDAGTSAVNWLVTGRDR